MTTNVAIVDERDPLVHYTGSWLDGSSEPEPDAFQGTTRWSSIFGSTASFSFVGSSVSVFGFVSAVQPVQVSFTFLVDSTIKGTYTSPTGLTADLHHEPFWASPNLGDGDHTLVITQAGGSADGVLFLDYIMWNTTSVAVPAYFIDDSDPRVVYTPPWRQFGSDPDFLHTSQGSTNVGDSLSLQFDGTAISHYAGINEGSAVDVLNASFSIDGSPPVFFVPPPQASGVTNNNLYYSSGVLVPGTHKLVVTAENIHTVWADYWLVTPNPASFSATPSPSSSPSPSGTSISTSSQAATTSLVPPKKKHTAAIAGSVVGVVVLLLFLLLGALLVRRRHRRNIARQRPREPIDGPGENDAASPSHFAGSGSPFLDILAGGAWPNEGAEGTSAEWAGPSGAAPPVLFARRSTGVSGSAAGGSSVSASAGSSSGNALSPAPRFLTLASGSGAPPSGKTPRYEAPPTRAAASEVGDGEVSEAPPGYESACDHSNRA